MSEQNVAVAVFNTSAEAEGAFAVLRNTGFGMDKLSIAKRSGPNQDGRHERGCAIFAVPDLGEISVLGPLGTWLISVLENAAIFGELTAFGAGLYAIGVSKTMAMQYEDELRANKCLVIAHGSIHDVARAKEVLARASQSRRPATE
jgi:hypothetical protein